MKKLEKIALGSMILLACTILITWSIGVIWHAPNGGTLNIIFNYLVLGFVISFSTFACTLFYNEIYTQE
jgi:hypothetical protein